jgi:pyridoxine 4-dehydrogenase
MPSDISPLGGSFAFGDGRLVGRLGYGTMQLPGPGVWGEPLDHDEAIRVLRRAVEGGVTLIDTADVYGPEVAERLIAEALYPYPDDLVVATKAGMTRSGPNRWGIDGRPERLRAQAERSLHLLRLDRIELFQLHRIDPAVPLADQLGALRSLQDEGKVGRIGLSQVSVTDIAAARRIVAIDTVQNRYNLSDRSAEDVLQYCAHEGIGFIPWFPIATGHLAQPNGPLAAISAELGATPAQLALSWLLQHSPVLLPIPGTSNVAHLNENLAAADLALTDDAISRIDVSSAPTSKGSHGRPT